MIRSRENFKIPSTYKKSHVFDLTLKSRRLLQTPFFTSTLEKSNLLDLQVSRYDLSFKLKKSLKKFSSGRFGWPSGGSSLNQLRYFDVSCHTPNHDAVFHEKSEYVIGFTIRMTYEELSWIFRKKCSLFFAKNAKTPKKYLTCVFIKMVSS
jgi:hypothetical protein